MKEDFSPEHEDDGMSGQPMATSLDDLARKLNELLERAETPASEATAAETLGRRSAKSTNPASFTASAASDAAGATGPCPGPGDWLDLAIGVVRPEQRYLLLAHAAGCAACSARLRDSLYLMEAQATADEAAEAASFAAASQAWHHRLAVELARTPHRSRKGMLPGWPVWAGAGLAASLALAVGLALWWQHINTPERLLAEAYSQSRIFDLRMPGAGFADVVPETHLRGNGAVRESSHLLDARARIEKQLESSPEDPHWLELEARADLLEEKFDPAIDILDRLVAAGPVTSELLADDAAAYFQRGAATGSENDRATALDYLRRADELNPSDPVVLFNEAVAMEDRGQVMNAVEVWNRYLRFERDPRWQAEGRRRLEGLEQKLNRLRSHQSRMEQHLSSPEAMQALADDSAALGATDEELSSTLLPRLLDSAFAMPVDRSRGSPCDRKCLAARTLLRSLANSLELKHHDSWLSQFLPAANTAPSPAFLQAAHALASAINANLTGEYLQGKNHGLEAVRFFHSIGNAAGEERSQIEAAYAIGRSSDHPGCYRLIHPLVGRNPQFAWMQVFAVMQDNLCDSSPGTGSENDAIFTRAIQMAHDRGYMLLELRARNLLGAAAVDTGDAETSWRIYLPSVRMFYSGDYPPLRLYTTLSGLEEVEESTPRVQLALALEREVVGVLENSTARNLVPTERFKLAANAIRAGSLIEAQQQMRQAQTELAVIGDGESVKGYLAEDEMAIANVYLEHHDFAGAAKMLEAAGTHIAGSKNTYHIRQFATERAQLEMEQKHPERVEPLLHDAVLEEERMTAKGGANTITSAQQGRDLYATLAAVWLAQGRPGDDILAMWERYRLRILGKPVPQCPDKGLTCLKPELSGVLSRLGNDQVVGQIVLPDRTLIYRADSHGVSWDFVTVEKEDVLSAEMALERATSSPATSQDTVHQAARRVGNLLLGGASHPPASGGQLLVESDPLLGNLPWPAVETGPGALGLEFDLEQSPSVLLLPPVLPHPTRGAAPLVVGASIASEDHNPLPEVLDETRAVARFERDPKVLVASQATAAQVTAYLPSALALHIAGHAVVEGGSTRLLLASAPLSASAAGTDKAYLDSDLLRRHPPRLARLAVFSACTTGKREEGWNHGMGDLVDTLASLGVPEVVATRWQIDSSSAVPMMDAFYAGLAQGYTVSHALTAARQSLIRDPKYRHPYYWAAYYASGSGKPNLSGLFRTVHEPLAR